MSLRGAVKLNKHGQIVVVAAEVYNNSNKGRVLDGRLADRPCVGTQFLCSMLTTQ